MVLYLLRVLQITKNYGKAVTDYVYMYGQHTLPIDLSTSPMSSLIADSLMHTLYAAG